MIFYHIQKYVFPWFKLGRGDTWRQFFILIFPFRGLYIAVIFYYKDNMLVTNEDQIPIVEIDDSHTSSITQDFLWFTKVYWVLISFCTNVSMHKSLQTLLGSLQWSKYWGGRKLSQRSSFCPDMAYAIKKCQSSIYSTFSKQRSLHSVRLCLHYSELWDHLAKTKLWIWLFH